MKNSSKENIRYFQFPLCLVQYILLNPDEGYNTIINYGLVHYAKSRVSVTHKDVCRQLMYDFYRAEDKLSAYILRKLKQCIKSGALNYNEDYNGFDVHGGFDPVEETEQLKVIFEEDKEFEQEATFHYQIHKTANFLNVKLGSMDKTLSSYEAAQKLLIDHENRFGKEPQPGIKTTFLFDLRDKKNEKDNELLCAYIAIRSILGKNTLYGTNKSVILMRMIGAKSNDALEEHLKNPKLKEIYDKYSKRRRFNTLLEQLIKRGFLKSKLYHSRRIYVSHEIGFKELPAAIIQTKKKYDIKSQEKEAGLLLKELFKKRTLSVQ